MNEVKRYDAGCDYAGEEEMVERADGDFVRHEDYAALKDSAMDYAYRWSKAQDDIKKAHMLHSMQKEEIANLKEQLTATTNSLTNAQEALKSAGIEADTVQAGVMELVNKLAELEKQEPVAWCNENDLKLMVNKRMIGGMMTVRYHGERPLFTRPAPAIDLNAVRAEGVDKAIEHLHNKFASTGHVGVPVMALEWLSAELRAGNAGKDK